VVQSVNPSPGVVGLNGKFARESAVDEYTKFYALRASEVSKGVEGCPHGPARVKNVVDDDDSLAFDEHIHFGGAGGKWFLTAAKVVSVKGDVQKAIGDRACSKFRLELGH
jgi:hypothetical protein